MPAPLRLVPPPPDAEARSTKQKKGKVLVVEADYFALTSRIDPNVTFWDTNTAWKKRAIPRGITHLWISGHAMPEVRDRLEEEALDRKIEIWNCSLFELRRRLMPFWNEPRNRSLMIPADPEESLKVIKRAWKNVKQKLKELKKKRLSANVIPPRTPSAPAQARKAAPPQKSADVSKALAELPDLDREVFSLAHGLGGRAPLPKEAVAKETGLPVPNLERILTRVRSRLEALGIKVE